jgi:phosphonate transport system substrate-binding protein
MPHPEVYFMTLHKRLFILILLPVCFLLGLSSGKRLGAEDRLLVFGRVHDDPVRSIRDRQEFVDYIAKKLAPVGITGGRIMVVEKIRLLAPMLREGKVDLFHDSVVPTLVLAKSAGSVPILRQWKNGEAEYEGVIVAKKNTGIETLSDLKGKLIAFEEPHSTSGSILPRMLFEKDKLKLVQISSRGTIIRPDAVGYIYGADGSSANALITGRADAATASYREIERLKPEIRDNIKIIGKTITVPRYLLSIRKDLDARIVNELKKTLTNMDKDPEGKGILKRQQNTIKFDEIPPEALEQFKQIERYVFSSLGKEVASW